MQQAARNVALENSRLKILLRYRGVTDEEIDKFLQTFPDQGPTDAAKATVRQPAVASQPVAPASRVAVAAVAPKIPLQPLPRPSLSPVVRPEHIVPQINHEDDGNTTRSVVDAIVGIKREPRKTSPPSSQLRQSNSPSELRQPLLQPRPQPPALPVLPAIISGSMRSSPNPIDKLSVLANASVQQDGGSTKRLSLADELDVPSPPTGGPSPAMSATTTATASGGIPSTSPRDRNLAYRAPLEMPGSAGAQIVGDISRTDRESSREALGSEGRDEYTARNSSIFRFRDGEREL